ncbi:TPA: hypothetical protein RQJ82_002707 [Vibrio vulnificus]|nr:hypothetical protein [Vibrio vulnificus]HAS6172731.1 hypothetical protein [Vibrio vulnificus]HDY7620473.1 hypothetical protein [Vibrio vulnificus]
MRRKLERGIATLLITSVLLSIALVVTLGSYKTLFYQIKRAQNEVKSRQDHWLAEGGLECIYTKAVQDGVIPTASSIPECNIGSNTIVFTYEALAAMNNPTKVSSKVGYAGLSKNIVGSSSTSGYGAIKSTSNLYFNGSNSINPDPSKKSETENEWECRVATFKGTLKIFGNLTNKGLVDTVKPSNDFPSGQRCQSGFQSTLISSPTTENKDFVQDSKLDPFKDYFNTKRESWFEVMKNKKFTKISSTSLTDSNGNIKYSQDELPPPARVENCGKKISDQIANGHDLLWVYGSCHISDSELATLGENVNAKTPTGVVIVSHNGLFTTKGALRFKGLIYHFVSGKEVTDPSTGEKNYQADFSPTESDWESRDSDTITDLNTLKSDLTGDMAHHSLSLSDIVYYQRGAFHPSGGYVMDAYGKAALFNAALNLHFDSDAVSTPLSKINGKLKWQEGSWNAN